MFYVCWANFSVKHEFKNKPTSDKKRHFSSRVLLKATMGPISTPKVVENGIILKPFAPRIDPEEPLWRSKGAQRFHCEGIGRLKWSPKAHFDGFGVPRCPKKLYCYYTDAKTWPQGFHFEGFGLDFAYSHVFFECVCVTFQFFTVFVFFLVLRCCRCSHPAQASGANPDRPLAGASNSSKTNVTNRNQHHLQNQHHQQNQTQQASSALPGEPSRTSGTSRSQCYQQNQCH